MKFIASLLLLLLSFAGNNPILAKINSPSASPDEEPKITKAEIIAATEKATKDGYEVYGFNSCGFKLNPRRKQTVDVTFYLADDDDETPTDAVTRSIKPGECEHFGHTNLERPEFATVGKSFHIGPEAWPKIVSCFKLDLQGLQGTGLGTAGDILHNDFKKCLDVDFPKNACVVSVC